MGGLGLDQMLGGIGLLGQQQQQLQQYAWTGNTSSGLTNTYVVSTVPVEAIPPTVPHAESAVEWLDRRVAEVCLAL